MFLDNATVNVQAGRGGDGRVSFHRTRHNPKGGPDGGDGGRGGDVIVRASHNSHTLSGYRVQKLWRAVDGQAGGANQRSGKNGENLELIVPPGTLVRHEDQVLADLVEDGQTAVVARGGIGGRGNTHFKSSTYQAPKFAELGLPGDVRELTFELKLIADVGLVGLPNAGKSTLLSVISSARPKIADYAFTTLTPNLGVARFYEHELVVADIPGLIEGASEGKGLGDAFLRHVERTRALLHLVDATDEDVVASYRAVQRELGKYSERLAKKPVVVALSKSSYLTDGELKVKRSKLARAVGVKPANIMIVSAQEHVGLDELMALVAKIVAEAPIEVDTVDETIIDVPVESVVDWYLEPEADDRFVLRGTVADRWVARTNFQQDQAVERLRRAMARAGVFRRLKQLGAPEGKTIVVVGGHELTW
jgi:GTP-binding protein